jgi:L-alanine-DL-glutamate epimerase-like enolase superfamily enzyme
LKIVNIEYEKIEFELAEPYTIAYQTVSNTTNFILKIITDKGLVGYGCAAPDKEVTLETNVEVENAINKIILPSLIGENPFYYTRIIHELAPQLKSSALCMVDNALFDLLSKKLEAPLYKFLGGFRDKIPTSITIGILPFKETLEKAKEFVENEFGILKLKGGLDVEEDIKKIIALKTIYPDITLRFDGNQGYDISTAKYFVKQTSAYPIEIFEQPTSIHNESLLGILSDEIHLPVMADESLKSLKDAFRLTSNGLTDMINIKIQKVGGLQAATHINSVAKAAKNEVMVGCLDECALGISAGLHFCLSKPNVEYADLDGHLDLINDPYKDAFILKKGFLYPNAKFGLGI